MAIRSEVTPRRKSNLMSNQDRTRGDSAGEKKVLMNFLILPSLKERISGYAARRGMSKTRVIIEALEEYLDRHDA